MPNTKIRVAMTEYGLRQWQLAKLLHLSESTLCRKLREELPEDEQTGIVETIRDFCKE